LFKAFGRRSIGSQNDSHLFKSGGSKLKLILKTVVFYTALFFSLHLQGQIALQDDTILIKEVEIKGKQMYRKHIGFKITNFDSSLIKDYNNHTLADLISKNSTIYIKTYGPGGLATPSFRGTGPGHTQISWNNINLNNPMIGQFDLSLIPAGFIDNINIFYGGGSMSINSGSFGGVIDLETKPDWNDQTLIYLNPGLGSFGRHSGLVKIKAGKAGFQSVSKAFYINADNNFSYLNSISNQIPRWETRKNSEVRQRGFIQELYYRKLRHTFSARFWYQSASRNLPVPIISPTMNPPEKQNDESIRALITYGFLNGTTDLNFTAALISDKLEYTNEIASVKSGNFSKRIVLRNNIVHRINEILKVEIALNNELNIVNTNNYAEGKIRNIASVDGLAEADITQWLAARLLVREILQNSKLLTPDFSASAEIRPFREKNYLIKAGFSKNSKIPTLNDMYWSPGGNPELENETGYSSEITWEMTEPLSKSIRIKNDITFFRNYISNMIQWHPGDFSYWEADNISNLVTTGLEAGITINYTGSAFNALLNAGYSMTKAINTGLITANKGSAAKQLAYIPMNQINALLRISWKQFYSIINSSYTGRRFLNVDNSQYLPQYSISDFNLGIRLNAGNTDYDMGFIIENIFNVNYQNIAYYPMPGRSYMFSVIFQFIK